MVHLQLGGHALLPGPGVLVALADDAAGIVGQERDVLLCRKPAQLGHELRGQQLLIQGRTGGAVHDPSAVVGQDAAVGRPEASTIVTPCAAAASSAARVRGVTIFSSLVRVPSRSSASTRIFDPFISIPHFGAHPPAVSYFSVTCLLYNERPTQRNPPAGIYTNFFGKRRCSIPGRFSHFPPTPQNIQFFVGST